MNLENSAEPDLGLHKKSNTWYANTQNGVQKVIFIGINYMWAVIPESTLGQKNELNQTRIVFKYLDELDQELVLSQDPRALGEEFDVWKPSFPRKIQDIEKNHINK